CRGHLSPSAHALLGPVRHDRGCRAGRRPRLPARAVVARDREQAGPAYLRRRQERRRHRMGHRTQTRPRHLTKGLLLMTQTKILWGQITIVLLIVLVTTWAGTQWVAWRFGFQPQLGAPWFELF